MNACETRYLVQVGRYRGAYRTRYATTNEAQAYLLYRGLNVGYGYKARLRADGRTLARKAS